MEETKERWCKTWERKRKHKFGKQEGGVKNQEKEKQTARSKSSKRIYVLWTVLLFETVLTGVKKWDSLQEQLASEIRSALGSAAPVKQLCLCLHTFPFYELNIVLYGSRWDSTLKLFYVAVGGTAL
jgi:hypothetical protein